MSAADCSVELRPETARTSSTVRSGSPRTNTSVHKAQSVAQSGRDLHPNRTQCVALVHDARASRLTPGKSLEARLEDLDLAPGCQAYTSLDPPRVQFCDPSIAVAALRTGPDQLLADLNYFGYLFEALVMRDLRVFADVVDGTEQHYRDSDDLEIDAVVTAGDGRWAAFEVKLGQADIDTAAANLLTFARKVDTTKVGEPATLAVVTATGYGYTRPDGVAIIPAATLGP